MIRTVRITSNGKPGGSEVVDVETGKVIPGVTEIEWRHEGRMEVPEALLTIALPQLEIEGRAEFLFVDENGEELELKPKASEGGG